MKIPVTIERPSRPIFIWLHLILFALLAFFSTVQVPLDLPAIDSFHEGEYAMYAIPAPVGIWGGPAVLIHGGINHIPSRLARAFCAVDHQIFCIRTINTAVTGVSAGLFVAITLLLTGVGTVPRLVAGLPALALLLVSNGAVDTTIGLHQGAVSIRDVGVLAGLMCFVVLIRRGRLKNPSIRYSLALLWGMVAGLGIFWAYNRGLAGVLITCASAGLLSVLWRDIRLLIAAVGGLVIGLAISVFSGVFGSLYENILSIHYWYLNDNIWRLPRTLNLYLTLAPAFVLVFVLVSYSYFFIKSSPAGKHFDRIALVFGLGCVAALYAAQSANRPDVRHIMFVMWSMALLAAVIASAAGELANTRLRRGAAYGIPAVCVVVFFVYGAKGIPGLAQRWVQGVAANGATLFSPLPKDRDLIAVGLREAADIIRASGMRCTYSFTNEGLLYVAAQIPPCARFAYPIYVSLDMQGEVIAALDRGRPEVILTESPNWLREIDGRSLAQRTPDLAAWVERNYPYKTTLSGGYGVRSRTPLLKSGG